MKILVIDDQDVNIIFMRHLLKDEGCEIDEAKNGQVGLEMIELNSYDIIFCDLEMPVMNGIELLQEINKKEIPIPIFIVTSLKSTKKFSVTSNTQMAGARGLIKKPTTLNKLLLAIKQVKNDSKV